MSSNITEILVTQVYVDGELLERQPFELVFTNEGQAADRLDAEGYEGYTDKETWFIKPEAPNVRVLLKRHPATLSVVRSLLINQSMLVDDIGTLGFRVYPTVSDSAFSGYIASDLVEAVVVGFAIAEALRSLNC